MMQLQEVQRRQKPSFNFYSFLSVIVKLPNEITPTFGAILSTLLTVSIDKP
jgi:hypothetical protein